MILINWEKLNILLGNTALLQYKQSHLGSASSEVPIALAAYSEAHCEVGFLHYFTHWTFKDTPRTVTAAKRVTTCRLRAQRSLTTIGLITHIWAVGSVVTQVFHEDTCPVTTPVLILHAVSDFGDDWKGRRGTVGRMSNVHATTTLQPREAGYNRVTAPKQNTGQTRNYNVMSDKCRVLVLHWV